MARATPSAPTGTPYSLETLECCPLCDSRRLLNAPVQPEPPFGLLQCAHCGVVFLSPRPPVDAVKTYYDALYEGGAGERNPRQDRRAQRHLRRLMRYAPAPGRLLEIGAGDGYFLNAARLSHWQVEGLELSGARIARARQWFSLSLHCCELSAAPFARESFDAIAMLQLLEHLHDPREALRRTHELLRPGGLVVLSTPNVLAYARKSRDVNSWRIPRHLFFFSPRTLVRTVERAGFVVLRRSLRLFAALEERLGWQPWPATAPLARATRDLWTPFGLHLVARKV